MKNLLLRTKLDIEPVTWGTNDAKKRTELRKIIREHIPLFGEQYMERLLKEVDKIEIVLNCYLVKVENKDIDNLAKIPIDALFFSAKGEIGYNTWESKIVSLHINKFKSLRNGLDIIIYGEE